MNLCHCWHHLNGFHMYLLSLLTIGNSPLILATRIGNLKCAQLLVKHGADLCATPAGRTALHFAVEMKNAELANWLVRRGASLFSVDHLGQMPIDKCPRPLLDELIGKFLWKSFVLLTCWKRC